MPYIPEQHEKYNLLPYRRRHGGEVFNYPDSVYDLEEGLRLLKYGSLKRVSECIFPYGYDSYEQYYGAVDNAIEFCMEIDSILAKKLQHFKETMTDMNTKENWSVVRFVGNDQREPFSFKKNQCYYCPTSISNPVYEGIISKSEFSPTLYQCNPNDWIIEEDPTGIAAEALKAGAEIFSDQRRQQIDAELLGSPLYQIVKSIIDKWNPYSLLPGDPLDNLGQCSLEITRKIRTPIRVEDLAWTIKGVMREFLNDDNLDSYLDVATSIYEVTTVDESMQADSVEANRVFEVLIDGTNEEIEEIASKYAGRLRYGWHRLRSGSFSVDIDNVGIRSKGPDYPPNCVKIYGKEHSF